MLTLWRGRWCRGQDDVMRIKYCTGVELVWRWCAVERQVNFGIGIVDFVAVGSGCKCASKRYGVRPFIASQHTHKTHDDHSLRRHPVRHHHVRAPTVHCLR